MTENAFDAQGREWFIPPCAKEIRVSTGYIPSVNDPDTKKRRSGVSLVNLNSNSEGKTVLQCAGIGECIGGIIEVDPVDASQPKAPETTIALRGICTARQMFYSENIFIRPHEVTD